MKTRMPEATPSRIRSTFVKFGRNERGEIAIAFGLLAVLMMMFIGAAIDLSKWLSARTDTLNAVDSAVLAGARSLQVNAANPSAAVQAAEDFYAANTRGRLQVEDGIEFVTARNNTALQAKGSAWIKTPFLGFAGVDQLPLVKLSAGEFAEAVVAVGGNSQTELEIAMMLDVTGSMAGSKLADLKTAAKDLIDIVVWDNQSEYRSRVALVPFSEAVRVPNSIKTALNITGASTITFIHKSTGKSTKWTRDNNCVTERLGVFALTDDALTSVTKPGLFYDSNGQCTPTAASVVPMTADKAYLKSQIDSYVASGNTAGHLGTAWAWYMLSPNWNSIMPAANRVEPYSKLTELNAKGQPKLKKIAVLMTDGEYNQQYCPAGIVTSALSCSIVNGNPTQQAATLCTNMKAKGIEVYTVGFALGGNTTALNMLRNCASNPDMFYQADDGEQLKQSFRNIALKISDLFLSK
ncbi:MAG: vWA domain-containing protein [Hyphomicrobiaceae bacterium]